MFFFSGGTTRPAQNTLAKLEVQSAGHLASCSISYKFEIFDQIFNCSFKKYSFRKIKIWLMGGKRLETREKFETFVENQ